MAEAAATVGKVVASSSRLRTSCSGVDSRQRLWWRRHGVLLQRSALRRPDRPDGRRGAAATAVEVQSSYRTAARLSRLQLCRLLPPRPAPLARKATTATACPINMNSIGHCDCLPD